MASMRSEGRTTVAIRESVHYRLRQKLLELERVRGRRIQVGEAIEEALEDWFDKVDREVRSSRERW